jgi:bifunctional non-homologous end joining protein LigD
MASKESKIKHHIRPMLATAVDKPFSDKDWVFELKFDGYRAIAEIKKGKVRLYSRNGLSMSGYTKIMAALFKLKTDVVLDGEIVLLNESGKPDFQKLQNYADNYNYPIVYYAFDILSFQQKDLTKLPLIERKKILKGFLKKNKLIRYSEHVDGKGEALFKEIRKDDIEGIMAKKKNSLYVTGVRTKSWLKIKNHKSQEAIIIGFTEPKGSRMHFGSLLLAQYSHKKLKYIGHAGTGFTHDILKQLQKKMAPLVTKKTALDKVVKANAPVTWIKPKLVCEVGYSEITRDGILRHPVFKRLRPEKKSSRIKLETEKPLPVKKIVKKNKK